MPSRPASKAYLRSLYQGKPISICTQSISGREWRSMDFIVRITLDAITTRTHGYFSYRTGYHLGIQVGGTSYIEEYF